MESVSTGNDARTPGTSPPLDLLILLLRRWKFILAVTASFSAFSVAVALLLPPMFRAESRIIPPQVGGAGMMAQMFGQLGGIGSLAGEALGAKGQSELYVDMLRSRTVLDCVIDRFGLMKVYRLDYREETREKLLDRARAEADKKSGVVTLTVEDEDPDRASGMANLFVEQLKTLSAGLMVTEASLRKSFYERQLVQTKANLARAEEGIRGFQERTGALHIESQLKAMIEGIATLRAQIALREVQMQVLRTYATENNPDLQRLADETRALRKELSKMEFSEGTGHDPLMPTGRAPSVGIDYARRLRDVKYQEALFEALSKQYELARLDEVRESVGVQVIDVAVSPDRKAKPWRTMIVLLGTVSGLLFSIFIVFARERFREVLEAPENREKAGFLRETFPRFFRKGKG